MLPLVTLSLFALLNGLVSLVVPVYCLYIYISKRVRGALVIALGIILAFAISFLSPVVLSHILSPESFQLTAMSVYLTSNLIVAFSLIYGLSLIFREMQS